VLTGAVLYGLTQYFPSFHLGGGLQSFALAGFVLALLNATVYPILRLITTPLRWLTLGLFGLVINMAVLALADSLLPNLTIDNLATLFWASLVIAIAHIFF